MAALTWINHASFVLEHESTRLITDPWLSGTAFDDGWAHLSPTHDVDWSTMTHIWISHEHPDHFSPRDLSQIPGRLRASITVLYQQTSDGKVLDWCRSKGLQTRELDDHPVTIGPGFSVEVHPWSGGDSFLYVKVAELSLLNLNDCVVRGSQAAEIAERLKLDRLDVLMTQFSYANWHGNPDEPHVRKASASEKLGRISNEIESFRPEYVIPFASFVWFCHTENRWMNDEVVTVDRAATLIDDLGARPIVLYPGDVWDFRPRDNTTSLTKYAADYASLDRRPSVESATVPPEELIADAAEFVGGLRRRNNRLSLRTLQGLGWLQPTRAWVTDHQATYELTLAGLRRDEEAEETHADISLGSEALAFCFRNLFGGNTLHVSGRFTVPSQGSFHRFMRWMSLAQLNNQGMTAWRSFPGAIAHVRRRIQSRLGIGRSST